MHTKIYVNTCTYIHIHIHTHMHTYAHTTCTHIHTCTHAHSHAPNMHIIFCIHSLEWSTHPSSVSVRPFTRHVGPTVLIPRSPLQIFLLIFTTTILQWIVDQTNLFASQCLGERFETRQQVTIDELKAYMGFMILMGLVKLPSIPDYWKRDEVFNYESISSRIT